ncbi:MAG TPA: MauE/DoxX family redox-associated membrane protein [Parafilimonas sp.]|nr:MauE/DoxX family redox-associated membrane protein [Parafilimonas sp.]
MQRNFPVTIIACVLIFLFAYTAFSKLNEHELFYSQLRKMPWISGWAVFISWFVPFLELVTVFLLLFTWSKPYGLYSAVILLSVFTFFIIAMVLFNKNLPCSCGGVMAELSWKQHIFLNLFFLLLSLTGIINLKQKIV